jgi:formylglycine-generating enzyme required for sulfatase activity
VGGGKGRPRWRLLLAALALAGAEALALWRLAPLIEHPGDDLVSLLLLLALVWSMFLCVFAVSMMLFAALFMAPRPDMGAWREVLSLYRAVPELRPTQPDAANLNAALKGLSDDALRVASVLPSHSEAGRLAAAQTLKDRGAASGRVPAPVVPGFFHQDQLDKAAGDLFGAREAVRVTCLMIGGVAAIVTIAMLGWNYLAAPVLVDAATNAGVDLEGFGQSKNFTDVPAALLSLPGAQSIAVRTKIGYVCMCIALLALLAGRFLAWVRAHPARVLLLRKFNEQRLGKYYKRLIREELQPLGHVVALSDKYVRRSMGAWLQTQFSTAASSIPGFIWVVVKFPILLLLRLTDRTRWGPAFIATPRDFRLLGQRLYDRMWLNLETSSLSLAYLIRTTDAWWKLVIEMLLRSADVVVLDLSYVTAGTAWEIDTIGALELWERVVCIAHDQEYAQAAAALQNAFGDVPAPPILTYNSSGAFAEQKTFRDRLVAALQESVSSRRLQDAVPTTEMRRGVPAAVAVGIALVALATAWANWQSLVTMFQSAVASVPQTLAPVARQEAPRPPGFSFRDCTTGCPEMIVLPGGTFTMGAPPQESARKANEGPQHSVTIAPFAVGKFEVTYEEWFACASDGGCATTPKPWAFKKGNEKHPAVAINWNDAQEYLQWLSARTGKTYHLLSEAEWEYAARGGTSTAYDWGDAADRSRAQYGSNMLVPGAGTAPVGSFAPNAYGLYDMAGNAAEWTQDCVNPDYTNAPSDGSAWITGECSLRRVRGGSWEDGLADMRSAARDGFRQNQNWQSIGFRVARNLP